MKEKESASARMPPAPARHRRADIHYDELVLLSRENYR